MKWVVKIGGGLYDAPQLPKIVKRLHAGTSPAWIVPGGGPFADQVRAAQKRWGFDDCRAHAMALLGMRQYGLLLAALGGFSCSESFKLPTEEASCVWLPTQNLLEGQLAQDWRVTSDSIAAWLAVQVAAEWLVLVKPLPSVAPSQALQLVDAAFIEVVKAHGVGVRCAIVGIEQWLADDFSCDTYCVVV